MDFLYLSLQEHTNAFDYGNEIFCLIPQVIFLLIHRYWVVYYNSSTYIIRENRISLIYKGIGAPKEVFINQIIISVVDLLIYIFLQSTLYRWRVRERCEIVKKRVPFIPNPPAVLVRLNPLGNNCLSNSIPLAAARYSRRGGNNQ